MNLRWWSRGLCVLVIVLSFAGQGQAYVDEDHDGIGDSLEQFLAENFAPVIFIEPNESNYPANVDWILQRSSLWFEEDCSPDVDEIVTAPIGTQGNLLGPPWIHPDSWGPGHPVRHCGDPLFHRRISTIAEDPEGEDYTGYSDQMTFYIDDIVEEYRVGSLDPRGWVTYFHAYPTFEGGIMIQYWHTFAYNQFGGPAVSHGGDWDATIHVQLDSDLNLKGAWFSRHSDDRPGSFIPADELYFYGGTHILMTIDGGGHAAFASPEDWCDFNTGGSHMGTIAWTTHPNLDPASLRRVEGGAGWCNGLSDPVGGTVWRTWTGGNVHQTGSVEYSLSPNPSVHGGLTNVGEYNPCTPTTCVGSRQASTLLPGQSHPLNNQIFVRYSGRWGHTGNLTSGPRGPVFQGFDDGVYTAWYNQGRNEPFRPRLVFNESDQTVSYYLEGNIHDDDPGPLCSTKYPYLISKKVTVPAGQQLSVCSGVTIRSSTGTRLKVHVGGQVTFWGGSEVRLP